MHPRTFVDSDWLWYCAPGPSRVFGFLWGIMETDFRVWRGSGIYHGVEYQAFFPSISSHLGSLKSTPGLFCFFSYLYGVIR